MEISRLLLKNIKENLWQYIIFYMFYTLPDVYDSYSKSNLRKNLLS